MLGGVAVCMETPRLSTGARAFPLQHDIVLMLGETPVTLHVLWNGPGPRFFHPHENETTSYCAAKDIVLRYSGSLVSLYHGGGRYIKFTLDGKQYRVDPNRIYTLEGVRCALRTAPQQVCDVVSAFATEVASYVEDRKIVRSVVIGMHNNTHGAYGVHSYTPGGDMAGDAAEVSVNAAASTDDFFLTTKRQLFEALKIRHYNVVLQKNPPQHDDGSFSVYCSQQNIPYVNVEAQDAHGVMQARMLRDLSGILSGRAA